jgi:hypothetical protein
MKTQTASWSSMHPVEDFSKALLYAKYKLNSTINVQRAPDVTAIILQNQ